MKQFLLFIFLISTLQYGISQDTNTVEKKITFDISGFVKTDFWVDSRKMAEAREGLFAVFPLDEALDANGSDINASPNFNYSVITSRTGLKINGFNAFGAKTFGYLEADFSGMSNSTTATFRLRHAYIQMDWDKSSLILGQFWHPMFVTSVFPSVISLNTGSPFQPFIRSPQIRYTQKIGNLNIIVAALAQRDYASKGPIGRSYSYLSNSIIPNAHIQLKYSKNKNTFGIAADYKVLKPRQITDSNIISTSSFSSISYMAYYKWQGERLQIKAKTIWGQNLTDNLMLGGYAIASIDPTNDRRTYTPTQHLFAWLDIDYTIVLDKYKVLPGIFFGYAKNYGTLEANTGTYYTTASNMDNMYRIAPNVSIRSGNTMLSLEYEYTNASYGDLDNFGRVDNTHSVSNNRLLFTAFYFF
ncbi:MAG: hypothetical protein KAG84_00295 [Bacteroidales bacterium]|nr:hypothetical protein [Bacteroidales bacterium]